MAESAQPPFTGKICCIGAGYVGGPTMAMMALKTPLTVTVVDMNKQVTWPVPALACGYLLPSLFVLRCHPARVSQLRVC